MIEGLTGRRSSRLPGEFIGVKAGKYSTVSSREAKKGGGGVTRVGGWSLVVAWRTSAAPRFQSAILKF